MNAVFEETAESIVRQKYQGYKITHLFGDSMAEYFRCTKWGIDEDGQPCILRSVFVSVGDADGSVIERPD